MLTEVTPGFGRAARSAGILTAGRQLGALLLTAGVLLLPRYVPGRDLDPFLWAYFGQLFVSSVLNLGLERYTAREVAADADPSRVLGAAMAGRALTALLTPLALVLVLEVVHVGLPIAGWVAVSAWTLAVQFEGVCFAGLRARGRASNEALIAFAGRVAQTGLLLVVATRGGGVVALLTTAAVVEIAVAAISAAVAAGVVGIRFGLSLPYRKLAVYAALELSVFAYLRTDLIIVGRLLGSGRGATYGLGYRLIDALVGLATPALLVLFAFASGQAARGEGLDDTRRRAQSLLPQLGVVLAAIAISGVGLVVEVLPRLAAAGPALRVLLATVPLTYLIGVETHLLSAEDRNTPVLVTAAVALGVNVVLNIALVPHFGMLGAAAALVLTEAMQVVGLSWRNPQARRGAELLAPFVGLLLLAAIGLNRGESAAGFAAAAITGAAAAMVIGRDFRRESSA